MKRFLWALVCWGIASAAWATSHPLPLMVEPSYAVMSCVWEDGRRNAVWSHDIVDAEVIDGETVVTIASEDSSLPSVMVEQSEEYRCSGWAYAVKFVQERLTKEGL